MAAEVHRVSGGNKELADKWSVILELVCLSKRIGSLIF
jgi:hypothetical protein